MGGSRQFTRFEPLEYGRKPFTVPFLPQVLTPFLPNPSSRVVSDILVTQQGILPSALTRRIPTALMKHANVALSPCIITTLKETATVLICVGLGSPVSPSGTHPQFLWS